MLAAPLIALSDCAGGGTGMSRGGGGAYKIWWEAKTACTEACIDQHRLGWELNMVLSLAGLFGDSLQDTGVCC